MHYYELEIVHKLSAIPVKILTDLFSFVETCDNCKLCTKMWKSDDSQNLEK